MDKYGPLYHRNSPLLPKFVAKSFMGVFVLVGIVALVLGVVSVISVS